MGSWKTTVASIVSAGGSFILFAQASGQIHIPSIIMLIAAFMNVGGLAAFGIVAKDYNQK